MTAVSSRRYRAVFVAFVVAAALLVAPAEPARAATLNVDNSGGSGCVDTPGSSLYCSIGFAVGEAAANDIVSVAPGTYVESPITIASNLTIQGTGPRSDAVVIQAASTGSLITVNLSVSATIQNLTLTGASGANVGGAVLNNGFTDLIQVTITGNSAVNNGAAVSNQNGQTRLLNSLVTGNTATSTGSALQNVATMIISNTTISGNSSTLVGSAINNNAGATMQINNATIVDNTGFSGVLAGGAGITVSNTILANNTPSDCANATSAGHNLIENIGGCTSDPTDIVGSDPVLGALGDNGGATDSFLPLAGSPAIDAGAAIGAPPGCFTTDQVGTSRPQGSACDIGSIEVIPTALIVDNSVTCGPLGPVYCTVTEAVAAASPGDVISVAPGTYNDPGINITIDLTIQGSGAGVTILDAGGINRVLRTFGATVLVEDLTMTNGLAPANLGGGAVFNDGGADLTLRRVEVTNSNATSGVGQTRKGGGVFITSGSLLIEDSVIDGNVAAYMGGGIAQNGGDVVIRRTTISNNDGQAAGGGFAGEFVSAGSTSLFENVTVSGNTAGSASSLDGGGLYFFSGGDITLNNVTVTDNTATNLGNGGGGIIVGQNDTLTSTNLSFSNTIIAGNTAGGFPDCRTIGGGFTITSLGNNLMGATDGCTGYTPDASDQTGTTASLLDPLLGPLADNGGPTLTHALSATSPARNAGSNATCEVEDQRGIARPQEGNCDIGAFELEVASTLQDLIDATGAGGTVLVPAGTYNEDITIGDGKTLQGQGAAPGDVVVLGTGTGPVVTIGNGDASFENLTIDGGSTTSSGGGILVDSGGHDITLTEVQVVGNDAALSGGGMWVDAGNTVTIIDSVFNANTAGEYGGAIYLGPTSTLDISGTTVDFNIATLGGGGIYVGPGATADITGLTVIDGNQQGIYVDAGGSAFVAASFITNNAADNGGAAYLAAGGDLWIQSTDVIGNTATESGGAVYAVATSSNALVLTSDVDFRDNSAADLGGAVAVFTSDGPTVCSVLCVGIYGVSFSNNDAGNGGGAAYIDADGPDAWVYVDGTGFDGNSVDLAGGVGGAILKQGSGLLSIEGSPFTNNTSSGSGGALASLGGTTDILAVTTFTANSAVLNGGAIWGDGADLAMTGGLFDSNDAIDGDGGAIAMGSGVLTVDGTQFTDNTAAADGGAIWILDPCGECGFVGGTIDNATFTGNVADRGGAVRVDIGADLTISNSDLSNNGAANDGGGASVRGDLTLTFSDMIGNTAGGVGGAIAVDQFGDLIVEDSLLDANQSGTLLGALTPSGLQGDGGAIWSLDDTEIYRTTLSNNIALGGSGGGIYFGGDFDDLIVDASTISGNQAVDTPGAGDGGGIAVSDGNVALVNSTLSGNSADGNGAGLSLTGGVANVNNVSFVNNSASGNGGAFNAAPPGSILVSNSLAAGNSNGTGGPNCAGLTSLGYNILGGNASGCTLAPTDIIGNAQVGPLADNGGPTQTHLLLPGSPAIDAASSVLDYDVFDGTTLADWQLNGFTDTASGGDLLLAAGEFNAGSAFITDPVPVDQDFTAEFTFQIAPDPANANQDDAADGLTFTISDDPSWLGSAGGFLGIALYDPIDTVIIDTVNGVSVEFDTWVNGAAEGANDPGGNEDHVGININGNLSSQALTIVGPNGTLSTGTWTAWIDYDVATTTLDVRVADTGIRPASPTVSTVVDIAALTGPEGYLGFTGATGLDGISGSHRIQSFVFGGGSSCEPTDQRGVVRPLGDGCDIGAVEVDPSGGALTVDLDLDGTFTAGSPVIPIDDLDVGTFFGGGDQPSSTQLGAIQLGAIQLGAIGSDLTTAAGYLTIGSIIDAAAELSAVPTILDEITLVDVPIVGGWESILALSSTLAGRPPYTVSLQTVIDDADIQAALDPPLSDYRLADSGVTASQLGAIQLGAIQLGAIQLGAIDPSGTQLGAIQSQMTQICDDDPPLCSDLGIVPSDTTTYDDEYSIMALTLLGIELDFAQLGAIQLGAIDPTGTQLGAIQLGAIQLGAIDTAAGTIGNTQLGAIQLGAIQLGAITLDAAQLGAIGSKADLVSYWCNDPLGGLDCGDLGVVEPSTGFVGDELDGYTILALGAMGADLDVLQLGAIQLGAIANLESTQLGAIQLGAIQLGAIDPADTQLGAIQLGAIQLGAIQLGAIDWDNVVFAQLGAIQLGAIQLGAIGVDGSLQATQLGAIQLGAIGTTAAQLGAIVNCVTLAGGCEANLSMTLFDLDQAGLLLPGATLADLAGALEGIPLQVLADQGFDIVALVGDATLLDLLDTTTIAELPPDLTLGELAELWLGIPVYELLLALLDPADLAWEDVDPAVIAAENPALSAGFSIGFQLTGDPAGVPEAEFPFTADVSITLPEGVAYVPGSSFLAVEPDGFPPTNNVPLADPEIDGTTARWIVDGVQLNQLNYLQFTLDTALTAEAGAPIAASVSTLGLTAEDEVPTLVPDLEPQNNSFGTAPLVFEVDPVTGEVLIKDVLTLGRIDPGDDIDLFKFEDLPAGASIEVYLNPGESDLDIVLFEPGVYVGPQLRGPIERVVDGSLDPTVGVDPNEQDQESLDDIANTDIAPVFKASLHRDNAAESIITPPLREGGDYFLQVSGYQLPQPSDVYVGRIRVLLPPDAEACAARPLAFDGQGTPGSLPANLAGVETIYLINQELFANTYGASELTNVLNAIDAIHDPTTGVAIAPTAAVIPVEADPDVAAAYAGWLTADGNCSVKAANLVAQRIAGLVDDLRADPTTDIQSVVIVGGDDQIPFFRVPDETTIANEREYATTFSGNNPLDAALRGGFVLSDAPMVDFNPLYVEQGNREIFVQTIPIGRLVEEPVEIVASLDQYLFSGGLLDLATATNPTAEVLGYDFLTDSSLNIYDELAAQGYILPTDPLDIHINETWTSADLDDAFDAGLDLLNANAHYDHRAALSAAESLAGTFNDLYTVDDLDPLTSSIYAGSTIYGMGCHAGLNAPGAYLSPTDELYDWAQALLGRQAIYIANTGFGYGDSDFQAYSEELMALLTEQLGLVNTIGEAHLYAAQLFTAQTPKWSPYHDKAMMEATLYGLPFYALRPFEAPTPVMADVTEAPGPGDLFQASLTGSPNDPVGSFIEERATDEGSYFEADDVLAVPFRPVQPLEYLEATPSDPNLVIRGAIVESGVSRDISGFDVLYARPILYDQDVELEYETIGAFPNALQAVTSYELPGGRADRVLLARGRYSPATQTQQIWDQVNVTAYYGLGQPADVTPPQIDLVSAIDQGDGNVVFTVAATDDPGGGVLRVVVLYKESGVDGPWTALELSESGNVWTGIAAISNAAGNIDYWAQVLGADGQDASSTDKAELHEVFPPDPPEIEVSGTVGNNGIYTSAVTVTLTPPANAPSASLDISTDGGATWTVGSSSATISDNGPFTVVGRLSQFPDVTVTTSGQIDTVFPTVTVVQPSVVVEVAQGAPLPLRFFCSDAESGIAKCQGTVTNGALLDTSVLGLRTAQVTATDRAGNVTTVPVTYIVSQLEPVTISAEPSVVAINTDVTFTAEFNSPTGAETIEWWFGDGEDYLTGGDPQVTGTATTVVHAYAETGVYPVTVRVTDSTGSSRIGTFNFVVVYDPEGGFVTGGGWIDSPSGAFTPDDPSDPDLVGRANFGFVSKYKKGQTIPTGNTVFKFEAGDLEFSSTSYEWLVVQGKSKASFKGEGVIDGWDGIFQFRVTVRDADGNDTDGFEEDAFRIQIWQALPDGTEWIVYDSGLGTDPDSEVGGTTPLGGGSIVIHTGGGGGGGKNK